MVSSNTWLINEINKAQDLICGNIDLYGLERYDPRDLDTIYSHFKLNNRASFLGLKIVESFFPIWLRKKYNIKKSYFPTTYYFLADSCLESDKSSKKLRMNYNTLSLIQEMLARYYEGNGLWNYKANKKFYVIETNHSPSMPLYGLARCNILLQKAAKYYNVPEFELIANKSLEKLFFQHQICRYNDGSYYVSYYYNSSDCTLNVNAELLEWISKSNWELMPDEAKKLFHGIIILLVNQQNEDGSRPYYSKEHMNLYHLKPSIDCHHTGSVIANLIHVFDSEKCSEEEKEAIKNTVTKGLEYYYSSFFNSRSGKGITEIGKKRKASTVQYSEALNAFTSAIGSRWLISGDNYHKYMDISRLIATQLLQLIRLDGSAPGDSIVIPVNINSINWGNGAALWALTRFKNLLLNCFD